MRHPFGSRRGLRVAGLAALLASVACQPAARPPRIEPTPPSRRPNIILLLTDDLDMAGTPYMATVKSELIDRGLTFDNSFVTDAACCPSRSSTLTGMYVHNHGVLANKPPIGSYRVFYARGHENASLGVWLQAAGYRTGLVGKYLNRYPGLKFQRHKPPGWDEWQALFFPEAYVNYKIAANGKIEEYGEADQDYQTDVLATKALDFIRKSEPGKPFFLYLSPFAPHAPADPAPRHENLFPGLQAPRLPSFNEEDVSDKPAWVRAGPRMTEQAIAATDAWHRRRVQTLQAVDEMLARILATLREQGQLDNTYIFFTSDNGFQLGAHRLDHGKDDPYEESIHVPLVVRGPGVPVARHLPHFALNIDLAPTFLDLAGAPIPASVDGRSLRPLLGAPAPPRAWRKDFLVEHWQNVTARERERERDPETDSSIPDYAALRSTDYLYVEYTKTTERELYDLRKDPYELENIAARADKEVLTRLSARLAALKSCSGDNCREREGDTP